MSNLDSIEEFEQFTFKQWIALGTALGGLDVVKGVLRQTMKVTVETVRRLTVPVSFTAPAGEVDLAEFWQPRKGLWLSDDFKSMILGAAKLGVVSVPEMMQAHSDLAEPANEAEIDGELPEGHIFESLEDWLGYAALQLTKQWDGGTDGKLLVSTPSEWKSNLYRVRVGEFVLTVDVHWDVGDGRWHCYADPPFALRFVAGRRAFSATAA